MGYSPHKHLESEMTTRVSGSSAVMNKLQAERPRFIDELRLEDGPNYPLMLELSALGLHVELRHEYTDPKKDVCIDPDTGPYCPIDADEEEEDFDDEDFDY